MQRKLRVWCSFSCSDNRKSAIQNRKWVGLVAFVIALTVWVARAEAQQPTKIFRIGFLDASTASGSAVLVEVFRQELSTLGWIVGKNITIEYRFADGKFDKLSGLAMDMVRLKVDLIVVSGGPPALAAKSATSTIPIVMTSAGDPVGTGLVGSLGRPGGNVTGLSSLVPELNSKRLEILKDAVPKLARVGYLRELVQSTKLKSLSSYLTKIALAVCSIASLTRRTLMPVWSRVFMNSMAAW
jgi:ABC-type uncharacterized transport system substrate-binding protein